jgi:pyridoxal phosphate enzyme (YggS family)
MDIIPAFRSTSFAGTSVTQLAKQERLPMENPPDPVANLRQLENEIARVCADFDRAEGAVSLVAVSKTNPVERVEPLLVAGHRVFGENRVQEAMGKWPALRARYPDLELHLIGPLQTNKVREALQLFDVIETLDREKLAVEIAKEIQRSGRVPKLFVQINTGEEPQKAGIRPRDADAFIANCRNQYGLAIAGLMCIPPADQPPSPHFALLRAIGQRNQLTQFSMGMSADYEAAIQLGATHIRIGTAIFGQR